jgi:Domain of unknown function (DUF427)
MRSSRPKVTLARRGANSRAWRTTWTWPSTAGDSRQSPWTYPDPSPGYEALRDHVAFYPGRVDAAWLDDEHVQAQQSDFYGGWITDDLVGPFKGPVGTLAW